MIPEREPEALPPLSAGFAILLGLGAAYLQFAFFLAPILLEWTPAGGPTSPARLGIAAILAYGGAFALGAQRLRDDPEVALGILPAPRLGWLAALALLPSVLLISEVDNVGKALFPMPEAEGGAQVFAVEGMALAAWGILLAIVLPVVEEVFFRGLLLPPLVEAWGRLRGIGLCAFLAGFGFSVGLFDPWLFPIVAARGLLMGLLRVSTASLKPGLALNMAFGFIALMAMRESFGIPGLDDTSTGHTSLAWLFPASIATGIGLGLCRALLRVRDHVDESQPS